MAEILQLVLKISIMVFMVGNMAGMGAEASSDLSPEVSQSFARGKGGALLPDREQDQCGPDV